MISFVYSARREQLSIDECKAAINTYAEILDSIDNTTLMRAIAASLTGCDTYDSILNTIRGTLDNTCRQGTLIDGGLSRLTYFDICSKKVSLEASLKTFTTSNSALKYMAYYVWWIYSSIEQILDCIINNGSVSEIELVGIRTKDYIKDLSLEDVPKRFGSPADYKAEPLVFKFPHFNLFGPPMTTRTYSVSTIQTVYQMLGVNEIGYAKCGKTKLARPIVSASAMNLINIWGELAGKFTTRVDPKNLKRDFFYDFFLYKMCHMLNGLEFNVDTVQQDFEYLRDGDVNTPKYLINLKLDRINSLPFLTGLIY